MGRHQQTLILLVLIIVIIIMVLYKQYNSMTNTIQTHAYNTVCKFLFYSFDTLFSSFQNSRILYYSSTVSPLSSPQGKICLYCTQYTSIIVCCLLYEYYFVLLNVAILRAFCCCSLRTESVPYFPPVHAFTVGCPLLRPPCVRILHRPYWPSVLIHVNAE